ncbi:hypothetical protein MXD82_23765, partial [Escherichia coli]|nr:hypothetical protein [Escherichia coli]
MIGQSPTLISISKENLEEARMH